MGPSNIVLNNLSCSWIFFQQRADLSLGIDVKNSLRVALVELQRQDEELWRAKSQVTLLSTPDLNTCFLHLYTVIRRCKNCIEALKDHGGRWLSGREVIRGHIIDYFQQLFSSTAAENQDSLVDIIPSLITHEENQMLCSIPTEKEIFSVVKGIGPKKAPGPDGMTGFFFFRTYWTTIRKEVVSMEYNFFRPGFLPRQLNHTLIVLIPKGANPMLITHYRPISLCNVAYKIITKLLLDCLRAVMGKLIYFPQAAFVPGRSIQETTAIAQEIFHSMKMKKGRKGLAAIKIDMKCTYDRLEWHFIMRVLHAFGFDPYWIQLIQQCLFTVSFSVLLNGLPLGFFRPQHGVRQGDPISHFLFILCAKTITRLAPKVEQDGRLLGVKVAQNATSISHLMFADDLVFFIRANLREVRTVKNLLQQYEVWSSQKINILKPSIAFSRNTLASVQTAICEEFNLKKMRLGSKYLGFPLIMPRSKVQTFQQL